MNSTIDLHMHSTASDGKDRPAVLLEKIKQLGIRCFALSDHDTVDGVREMEELLATETGITFIRGIEFSCISPAGKCHILGYGYDWNNPAFRNVLQKGADLRRRKLEQRLDFLRDEYQIEFEDGDVETMRRMGSVGKPHLAELMVKMGVVDSAADAINRYINHCPTLDSRLPAEEAIPAIHAAGGIPVWAHPYGGVGEKSLSDDEFQTQFKNLRDIGIQGLECCYSQYSMEKVDVLETCAKDAGLCVSGGSDYHGRKKFPDLGTLNADGVSIKAKRLSILQDLGIFFKC